MTQIRVAGRGYSPNPATVGTVLMADGPLGTNEVYNASRMRFSPDKSRLYFIDYGYDYLRQQPSGYYAGSYPMYCLRYVDMTSPTFDVHTVFAPDYPSSYSDPSSYRLAVQALAVGPVTGKVYLSGICFNGPNNNNGCFFEYDPGTGLTTTYSSNVNYWAEFMEWDATETNLWVYAHSGDYFGRLDHTLLTSAYTPYFTGFVSNSGTLAVSPVSGKVFVNRHGTYSAFIASYEPGSAVEDGRYPPIATGGLVAYNISPDPRDLRIFPNDPNYLYVVGPTNGFATWSDGTLANTGQFALSQGDSYNGNWPVNGGPPAQSTTGFTGFGQCAVRAWAVDEVSGTFPTVLEPVTGVQVLPSKDVVTYGPDYPGNGTLGHEAQYVNTIDMDSRGTLYAGRLYDIVIELAGSNMLSSRIMNKYT